MSFLLRNLLLISLWVIILAGNCYAKATQRQKAPSCESILSQVSALLVQDHKGRILYSKNADQYYVPASTIKVLTAYVALKTLGEDYRFHTRFYLDQEGNLKVKGFGDPFITSEILSAMASLLANKVSSINHLVLDDSYFAQGIEIPGSDGTLNPYDSPVGALCVNFNTASVIQQKNGVYKSGEAHTPLVPYVVEAARRLNISSGRFLIARTQEETTAYFGHLFLEFLKRAGIKIKGDLKRGTVNNQDRLILDYESPHRLSFIVKEMLKYSSNFIANQLFLVAGAQVLGPPATLQKAVVVTKEVARSQIGIKDFQIVEGSGLSRENRFTAWQFMKVLKAFYPYSHLLKERNQVLYKTGTLKGVSNRIGYIVVGDRFYPFVILRNGNGPSSASVIDCLQRELLGDMTKRKRAKDTSA